MGTSTEAPQERRSADVATGAIAAEGGRLHAEEPEPAPGRSHRALIAVLLVAVLVAGALTAFFLTRGGDAGGGSSNEGTMTQSECLAQGGTWTETWTVSGGELEESNGTCDLP